jgi:hypothetical protein
MESAKTLWQAMRAGERDQMDLATAALMSGVSWLSVDDLDHGNGGKEHPAHHDVVDHVSHRLDLRLLGTSCCEVKGRPTPP